MEKIECEELKVDFIIFKECGKYYGTKLENFMSMYRDNNKVLKFDDCSNGQECLEVAMKWLGYKDTEILIFE